MEGHTIRRLILPSGFQKSSHSGAVKKPGPNSQSFSIAKNSYSFKKYLVGSDRFSYRWMNRKICNCLVNISVKANYDGNMKFLKEDIKEFTYVGAHSIQCC